MPYDDETNNALPFVSIVIAAPPSLESIRAVDAARELDYPGDRLEIIIARGKQPAVQRNRAVKECRGELIYFLDDDSRPRRDALKKAVQHFIDEPPDELGTLRHGESPSPRGRGVKGEGETNGNRVQIAGGPNLCPDDASHLQKTFSAVMSNPLAFGPSAARYTQKGTARETSEKELILCNLIIRKSAFESAGGFDEALYPNEENALMDHIQSTGGKLIYDPEVVVERFPRSNLRAFMRMLFNYGRGRAEQFRRNPGFGSLLNFAPPLFVIWTLASPWLPYWQGFVWLLYALLIATGTLVFRRPQGSNPILTGLLVIVTHLAYGMGFWRGLFTRFRETTLENVREDITIERI